MPRLKTACRHSGIRRTPRSRRCSLNLPPRAIFAMRAHLLPHETEWMSRQRHETIDSKAGFLAEVADEDALIFGREITVRLECEGPAWPDAPMDNSRSKLQILGNTACKQVRPARFHRKPLQGSICWVSTSLNAGTSSSVSMRPYNALDFDDLLHHE